MKIIRYSTNNNEARYGWLHEDQVGAIEGSIFGEFQRAEAKLAIDEVKLLVPTIPSKIICIGRNYASHASEHGVEVPESPLLFLKPPSALLAHEEKIQLPPQSQQVEHEAELCVVIGKRGRWITPELASEYILGYTIANDVTARDLQNRDGQWSRAKGFDTFCPIGPWIETEFDPSDSLITCYVNEEIKQMASTRDLVFSIYQLIAYASSVMTLEPGDLLLTGTPAGVGPLQRGDEVVVSIENLGKLRNFVEEGSPGISD